MSSSQVHAIIPAGGAGTRLWPLSTQRFPKFLLPLSHSGLPMIIDTVRRIESMAASIHVVTGQDQAAIVADVMNKYMADEYSIVEEPSGKNSMPAIGLAALLIHEEYGDSLVASFAADHVITDEEQFRQALTTAIDCAEDGFLVTLGINPDRPSTSFGYIEREPEIPTFDVGDVHLTTGSIEDDIQKTIDEKPWYIARRFHEKPSERLAQEYIRTERFYWNAGIFVCSTRRLIEFMREHQPQLLTQLTQIVEAPASQKAEVLERVWAEIDPISIDHALAEPLSREGYIAVVPTGDIGWSDVGTYDALADLYRDDEALNCVVNVGAGGDADAVGNGAGGTVSGDADANAGDADAVDVTGAADAGGDTAADDTAVAPGKASPTACTGSSFGDGESCFTLFEDCKNLTVIRHDDGNDRLVLAGLEDMVIVRTADRTLVTTREYAAKIPNLIEHFENECERS